MQEGAEDSDLRDLRVAGIRKGPEAWLEIHRELVSRRLDTTPQHTLSQLHPLESPGFVLSELLNLPFLSSPSPWSCSQSGQNGYLTDSR